MKKIIKSFFIIITTLFLLGCLAIFGIFTYFSADLPDVNELKTTRLQTPMEVFSADGELIAAFGEHRRIPLTFTQMPPKLIEAVIATEDARFFEHYGIDPVGITRAMFIALTSGAASQGGSTITQQVAKNFFLSPERTVTRKLKEMILALQIERILSKEEILELYLNKIYLGSRAYGVGAAAYTFFGKRVDELTIGEMALLAGLPKAPSAYNPIFSHDKALSRRNWVLGRMLNQGFISQQEYEEAVKSPLIASYHEPKIAFHAPYVAEMARQYMYNKFGENAYTDGYRVYTTIKKEVQLAASKALMNNVSNYDKRHGYRGPEKVLWKKNEKAWDQAEILKVLKDHPTVASLRAGVVMSVNDRSAQVILKNGDTIELTPKSVAWARPFHNSYSAGGSPKTVSRAVQVGQLIRVKKADDSWTLAQLPKVNSAVVTLDSNDGAIQALVGGYNFNLSKFNRATQSIRQIGSSIKPFVFAAAFNKGLTASTVLNDAPIFRKTGNTMWSPKNSPNIYSGPLRLRVALGLSKNVVTVRVIRAAGVDYTADFLHRFGFPDSNIARTESLALGSASFTPLQVARGYAVFANGGYLITPYVIDRIEDVNNKILFKAAPLMACKTCQFPITESFDQENRADLLQKVEDEVVTTQDEIPDENKLTAEESLALPVLNLEKSPVVEGPVPVYAPRTISNELAFLMRSMLKSNVWGEPGGSWSPTGARARALNRPDVGGKTGTTNKSRDAWFAGFGGNVVTTMWIGFDDFSEGLGNEGGSKTALPAWIEVMKAALKDVPVKKDVPPKGILQLGIDRETGQLSKSGRMEYFIKGAVPIFIPREAGTKVINKHGQSEELF